MTDSTDNRPINSNNPSIGTEITKKWKEMDHKSPVWQHFEKIFENGVLVKTKCLHCKHIVNKTMLPIQLEMEQVD